MASYLGSSVLVITQNLNNFLISPSIIGIIIHNIQDHILYCLNIIIGDVTLLLYTVHNKLK